MATHALYFLFSTLALLPSPSSASSSSSSNSPSLDLPLPSLARQTYNRSTDTSLHRHLSRHRRRAFSHDPAIEKRQVKNGKRAAARWEKRDEIELARRATPSNSVSKCSGTAGAYAQCGGTGFTGDTCCTDGWTCTYSNDYYSQCLPSTTTCTNSFYSQCGGKTFTGSTCCPSGSACVANGDYYSQCIPGASSSTSTTAQATQTSTSASKTSTVSSTSSTSTSTSTSSSSSSTIKSSSSSTSSTTSSSSTKTSSSTTSSSSATSTSSTKTSSTTSSAPSASATCSGNAGQWGQCGGQGWTGATCCPSGYYCSSSPSGFYNAWYSQCIPGTAPSSSTTSTSSTSSTKTTSTSSSSSFSTVVRSSSTSTTLAAPSASASQAAMCSNTAYAQCGGLLFLFGDDCCPSGYECTYSSLFYSQCLPTAAASPSTSSTTTSAAPAATSSRSTCKTGNTSDSCTPYTVTADGVTLPSGVLFGDAGNVNYRAISKSDYLKGTTFSSQSFGVHLESLNNQPSKVYIGKSFVDFAGAKAAFPSGYCIAWVQIDASGSLSYNQHFGEGGQLPVCTA
ncbi:hypothetical protein JCM8547_002352 [Rhodosporidiobolus lusitaniae]